MSTVAELEAQVALLSERVAYLESRSPMLMQDRQLAAQRERKARLQALGLDGYAKLGAADRDTWCALQSDAQLLDRMRGADRPMRDDVLARLPWQRRAMLVFALAPAPQLVNVQMRATFQTRHFNARKGEALVLDADAWRELCEREPRMREWLVDGSVEVRALSDDEARRHALNQYVDGWRDKQSLPGARGPELPTL